MSQPQYRIVGSYLITLNDVNDKEIRQIVFHGSKMEADLMGEDHVIDHPLVESFYVAKIVTNSKHSVWSPK
jgi:hypothetical protein